MKKIDFKKFLSYFNFHKEGGLEIKVLRDWKIIIFGFLFLFVAIIAVDGYIFLKYQKELQKEPIIKQEDSLTIDEKALQKALDKINMRSVQFENSLVPPEIKDPAI